MEKKSFALRIDKQLYEDIKAEADKNGRSVNKQIEFMLMNYHK